MVVQSLQGFVSGAWASRPEWGARVMIEAGVTAWDGTYRYFGNPYVAYAANIQAGVWFPLGLPEQAASRAINPDETLTLFIRTGYDSPTNEMPDSV